MPLDVCGAESQGQIGYLLQVAIGDVFFERHMERPVVTMLTLTRVHPDDPAFHHPTKPIGPYYKEDQARRLKEEEGYEMAPSEDGGWRRVVPSPDPYSIVEAPVIRRLVGDGAVVIAAGGGGHRFARGRGGGARGPGRHDHPRVGLRVRSRRAAACAGLQRLGVPARGGPGGRGGGGARARPRDGPGVRIAPETRGVRRGT